MWGDPVSSVLASAAVNTDELLRRADALPRRDRDRFRRRLSGAGRIRERERRAATVATIAADLARAEERLERRRAAVPATIAYPDLPITERRDELLDTIRNHQVVIVAGETGSGKSTQLPKLCLELGRGITGMIGHTQPRRIAARSIAERVAEELGSSVGELVGYKVRFSDQVGDRTLIKLMTDGILLNEIHDDRALDRYDTIILDEAHERGLNTDFLLGYVKALLPHRPDLKVIVTSATIDTARFAEFYDGAAVVEVSGRTYPVEVRYWPIDDPESPEPRDQPQAIADAVVELAGEGTGDVLVFVSGEREIRDAAAAVDDLGLPHTETLPLYGRLSAAEQHRVFQPHTGRRIVVSTNLAETSLTVPGIRYVVDAGTARISRFSRRTKVQQLPIEPISQASADQRAGRCGRLGPGIAIRLYAEDDYLSRPEFTEPEIRRTNLASVLLQMAALELGDIESFPFLDPPDSRQIRDGIALLEELGAVDPDRSGTDRWLTEVGRQLARFPVDPRLGRMLIEAATNGCLREALVIVAAMSIQDPRERPLEQRERADQFHARHRHPTSDFLTWLALWEYLRKQRKAKTSNQFRRMLREEFLNYRRVREWQDIHAQLRETTEQLDMRRNRKPADPDLIHLSLLAGLLSHVGLRDPDGPGYRGARGARFFLSPASTLFSARPEWLMAGELVETTRMWAHSAAPVQVEWIERLGGHLIKRTYSDPWWDADRGEAVANETVTMYGLPLVPARARGFGKVDPAAARELFIRHGLVAGEWNVDHAFVRHNAELISEVLDQETRERRHDLLARDDDLVAWFDARLPDDITTVVAFNRWWKEERRRRPHLLDLAPEDVLAPETDFDTEAFPRVWSYGDVDLPLEYVFDPASDADGLTVDVFVGDLDRLDPAAFEWHVPGYRAELVEALIRSMPKQLRKRYLPIGDTVAAVVDRLDPGDGGLLPSLRRELSVLAGEPLPVDAFDPEALPAHLRPRFRIVDEAGEVVAAGDDLAALKEGLVDQARSMVSASAHPLEHSGATSWEFGDLPAAVELAGEGAAVTVYPAIVDEGDTVGVRLVATPQEQADVTWAGARRLLALQIPGVHRHLAGVVTPEGRLAIAAGPHADVAAWVDDCLMAAVDQLLTEAGGPVLDVAGFEALLAYVRNEIDDALIDVATVSLEVLDAVRSLNAALESAQLPDATRADIERQRDRLIYTGFVTGLGFERLADVARYVAAMEYRATKAPQNPARDLELLVKVRALEDQHENLVEHLGATQQLAGIDWMLQELRVGLFAQQLGTKIKVSEKRVREALRAAEGV